MWKRCNAEVKAMAMAAAADKEGEYDRILKLVWRLGAITGAVEADFDGVWSRMSAAMRKYGSSHSLDGVDIPTKLIKVDQAKHGNK
ncbi:hypothetical protein IFR04_003260 [Cadophora malorum]|uniref:Uncharacterized protein n=1 Tax=Cadophora malorum TaxID=108018 RepID=A0A8H8BU11_9HELO|nr:hypothetical protein IFR04_003260 [Cadophora malorum]